PACETTRILNDWKRSVKYAAQAGDVELCDNFLKEGWYRITSKAGDKMPTSCPSLGFKCCTTYPLWLSDENVPNGDDIFPKVNQVVNRVTCASSFDGNCCKNKIPIKIKNCGTHLVYYLTPAADCNTAYCFGDKLPCPAGQSSETGFPPGCGTYPKVTVKPKVVTDIEITTGRNKNHLDSTFEKVKFECQVVGLDPKYSCNVRWYINNFPIDTATKKDIQSTRLSEAILRQDDWDKKYKPNMKVKCSLQIKQAGFTSPGPEQFSDEFLAGFIIHQTEYAVEEGKFVLVPVELTIPIGCSYPTKFPRKNIDKIKESSCAITLLTSIPTYQQNQKSCEKGLNANSLSFHGQNCGIQFANKNWKTRQTVNVSGTVDNMVNYEDRVSALRLYHDSDRVNVTVDEIAFWIGVTLEDIKFRIKDKDEGLLGKTCKSNNDPHVTTFEGMYFSFHFREGEYLLYRNKNLPVEVHGYYRKCNGGALCNCGAAVRSGNSAFIANFCKVNGHENRYVTRKICDKKEMVVEETSNSYKITTMSGSQINIQLGQVYHFFGINSFTIKASELERFATEGICGTLDDKDVNDLTPRGGTTPYPPSNGGNIDAIGESWRINDKEDSLFNIYKIKEAEYHENLKEYCTCSKLDNTYPYGTPDIECNLKSSFKVCTRLELKKQKGMYDAQCHVKYKQTRKRRSAYTGHEIESIVQEDDDAPVMYLMDVTEGEESKVVNTQWKNGWNALKAKNYCQEQFKRSASISVCSEHVPSVPSEKYINECIEDIKVAGDTSWAGVSVSNFGAECFHEATKMEKLTRANSTDDSTGSQNIFQIIAESTCPNNCSGHGICDNGFCNCTDIYFGPACERERNEAPDILQEGFEGLCDISAKPCKKYIIPGLNFMEGKLTCKYRNFRIEFNETIETGITETVEGEYNCSLNVQHHH
ncbi:Hypothetical predicted protein, partial [Mytilus galloprovincialis]